MSRRSTLVQKSLTQGNGRTIGQYIEGKSRLIYKRELVQPGATKAFDEFARKLKVNATSRPMSERKQALLRARFK